MRSSASSVRISSSPSSKSKIWALLAPAEEHLRRSAVDAPGDRDDGGLAERASLLERAAGLQHDAEPLAGLEEFAAVVEGVKSTWFTAGLRRAPVTVVFENRHLHAVSEVLEHRSIVHVRRVVSLTVSDSCQTTPTNADQP